MCSVYTVQCKTHYNTIHPRSIYIVPAHIYCGYANIVSISVHIRAHMLWI